MPAPSTLPGWDATGNRTEPTSGQKTAGWDFDQAPGAEEVNWMWWAFSAWIAFFATTAQSFPTLEELIDGLTAGDTGILHEDDAGTQPGAQVVSVVPTVTGTPSLTVTGTKVILGAGSTSAVAVDRDDLVSNPITYTLTNSAAITGVATNGTHVAVAHSRYVELFTLAGASVWVYDYGVGNVINDVAMDATHVYIAGILLNSELLALSVGAGAVVWTYDHNAQLTGVTTDGARVYVGGVASGHASGANLRAVVASNGFDATGEGGLGTDALNAWDVVLGSVPSARGAVTDGRSLWVVYGTTVERRGAGDGTSMATASVAVSASQIAVDHEYLLVSDGSVTPSVTAFDRQTLGVVYLSQTAAIAPGAIATDGAAWYAYYASGTTLRRFARGNRPGIWARADPGSDDYVHLRGLLAQPSF